MGFSYRDGELWCENVRVGELSNELDTPLFVYSKRALIERVRELKNVFAEADPVICYAVKSNTNMNICALFANEGTGFDIVSAGELFVVQQAGGDTRKAVFAGVGKRDEEIRAALQADILMFNVESAEELENINRIAAAENIQARIAFRFNPDVEAHTHAHITTGTKENKFGIDRETLLELATNALDMSNVVVIGLHMHIGSQLTDPKPYGLALDRGLEVIDALRKQGHDIQYLNSGGGFGISYDGEPTSSASAFAEQILPRVKKSGCRLVLEPGRYLVGNSGVLVTRVVYRKETRTGKTFVICDAAMTDLIRPVLYDAYHRIWPVRSEVALPTRKEIESMDNLEVVDVVGPVCESADYFAKDRRLPKVHRDDLLAIFSAGAYGMVMSCNYNGRRRACEVLVDGGAYRIIRRRETYEDLVATQRV